jgi:peptidoglycan hydrolase-like protein with peptidoglycan-binding domain
VQRALNAGSPKAKLAVSGSYDSATQAVVLAWQAKHGIAENGVFGAGSWAALQAGKR